MIYKLAEQFGMDSDPLKRHFVRELYSAGFDELAKEVKKVNEKDSSALFCMIEFVFF